MRITDILESVQILFEDVGKSFATLVKYNNGYFKSDKQAKFLLSKCDNDMKYSTYFNVYGNSGTLDYYCDEKGIYKVEKDTKKKGTSVTWKRQSNQDFAQSRSKTIDAYIKEYKRELESRVEGLAEFDEEIAEDEKAAKILRQKGMDDNIVKDFEKRAARGRELKQSNIEQIKKLKQWIAEKEKEKEKLLNS